MARMISGADRLKRALLWPLRRLITLLSPSAHTTAALRRLILGYFIPMILAVVVWHYGHRFQTRTAAPWAPQAAWQAPR